MPEKRLQRTRDAYSEPSWMDLTPEQIAAVRRGRVIPVRDVQRRYQFGDAAAKLRIWQENAPERSNTSAAYRMTQAQLAKDAKDERL